MRKRVTIEIPLQCSNSQGQDWTLIISRVGGTGTGTGTLTFDLHWKNKPYPNHSAEVADKAFVGLIRELIDNDQ